jgi:hypothetical protein
MKNFSVIFAVLAATLCLSAVETFAQSEPYKLFDTRPVITHGPYLVARSGQTATIVWMTDTPSHSKVRFAKGVTGIDGKVVHSVTIPSRPAGSRE